MGLDLKIVGGLVVDGTGIAPYRADVGIAGGHIVEVGRVHDVAARTLDAEGAIVTPGFTDLHTHYDGQVSWDGDLAPSSVHGVTTCVIGNCGVGFAPVRVRHREALIELMEGVEDIPGSALAEGLQWKWESFEEYMRAIDEMPHSIDVAAQVPHDALRMYVMGDRAIGGETATEDELIEMRAALRSALQAGAVGFSTGRTDNHRAKSGAWTPGADASVRELITLAEAYRGLDHGVLQAVSDFDMARGPECFDAEFDVLEEMAKASGGHPLSISLSQRDGDPMQWKRILVRAELANSRGTPVRVQVGARGIGVMLGLQCTFHPFMGFPTYKRISHLPHEERVVQMRRSDVRRAILSETSDKVAGDGSNIPPLADQLLANLAMVSMRLFRLGEEPNYEPGFEQSLFIEAQTKGVTPLEVIYDAMLEHDGRQLLYFPIFNYTEMSLDVVHTMLSHPLTLPGLSDGGAHVGTVCDASFPTFMLTHWTRDRERDRLPLERVVKMMTRDTSRFVGLRDRGEVRVGQRADLNVIDMAKLRLQRPRLVRDLPAGGQRLLQDAIGYRATLVRGEVIAQDGKLTGVRPGRLARPTALGG